MMNTPEPCPFCGERERLGFVIGKDLKLIVQCLTCGTQGPEKHDEHGMPEGARERALALWNTRP